ncbi:hypothetical protein GCM10018965_043030 [Nonomuraea roseola]
MTMYRANGTQINKTTAATLVTAVSVPDPLVRVTEHLWEGVRAEGTTFPPARLRLKYRKDPVRQPRRGRPAHPRLPGPRHPNFTFCCCPTIRPAASWTVTVTGGESIYRAARRLGPCSERSWRASWL